MATLRIGALASGGGTNLQAIIDAIADGSLDAEIRLVISNNSRSAALRRARAAGIPTVHLSAATHPDPDALDAAIADALTNRDVWLVALAGYMKKVGPKTLARFPNRVVNIHPSLLPKYGGRGMYGERVHAAVLAARERETGVTVHIANGEYDSGTILVQERVRVQEGDTPSTLATRVLEREHVIYPQTLQRIGLGEMILTGTRRRTFPNFWAEVGAPMDAKLAKQVIHWKPRMNREHQIPLPLLGEGWDEGVAGASPRRRQTSAAT